MELDKSIQRLTWRLTSNKAFKANQNDVDAFNSVLGWITSQKKINLLNHNLFAKLYIYELTRQVRGMESTVFETINQKEVSRILAMPLSVFYKAFHTDLHMNQITKAVKKEGVTDEELKEKYSLEEVTKKLNHMITEAINKFE